MECQPSLFTGSTQYPVMFLQYLHDFFGLHHTAFTVSWKSKLSSKANFLNQTFWDSGSSRIRSGFVAVACYPETQSPYFISWRLSHCSFMAGRGIRNVLMCLGMCLIRQPECVMSLFRGRLHFHTNSRCFGMCKGWLNATRRPRFPWRLIPLW